jgi:hypothetical protein
MMQSTVADTKSGSMLMSIRRPRALGIAGVQHQATVAARCATRCCSQADPALGRN